MRAELYSLNFPNGKKYIGITTGGTENRWVGHQRHASRGGKLPVHEAIRKYGAENVMSQTLVVGDHEYIKSLEIAAIAKFQTRDRKYGYNVTFGGDIAPSLDPGVAARISASLQKNWVNNPDKISRERSAISKKMWEDPTFKATHLQRLADIWANPELRKKKSAELREQHKDPKFIEAVAAANKAKWDKPGFRETKVAQTTQQLEKQWQDPTYREHILKKFADTECKRKQQEKAKKRWENPEYRARKTAASRAQWANPEFKEKMRLAQLERRRKERELKAQSEVKH